ncbi:MAG: Swt1 family HEPN domain-containing protein [Gammaproteobacteria bacterium]|nr:MAG: Swt1 family HEPN domain-containing protein [Gammaproteobacteria bacterium]
MAITNHERVGKALDLLRDGLAPFVERELKSRYGEQWAHEVKELLRDTRLGAGKSSALKDTAVLLMIMERRWNDVFRRILGKAESGLVKELSDARNRWAHQEPFSGDDADRTLDSCERLLAAVSAPQADEVRKIKMELRRTIYDEQVRGEKRKAGTAAIETAATGSLKPWREVITPHKDVASGRYQQAEFAADLWQVHLGEGGDEYRDPGEFFRRTYLTESLKKLLVDAVRRLNGQGGDPVVQLQTNFGGGKTHSMLALYHLFSGKATASLAGVDAVIKESGAAKLPAAKRVVLVGNKISPGNPVTKPDGTVVRTLWGELAWQLGGKKAYQRLKADDEKATSPGDVLRELFKEYGPCLILIDEWVAYARQLHDQSDLPAGGFETQFSFAQVLTESAKAAGNCLLVISLPASDTGSSQADDSDVEVGGVRGREALARLRNVVGRLESSWRPATAEEGFEIVRRRLFEPMTDPAQFKDRDVVARAFADCYRTQQQEFPPECRDADYEKRIKAAYPIHPEVFDRLYTDWSTLVKFQRTRGVLRLMAAVIHSLWEQGDRNPLILPSNVPISDPRVQFELTRYLSDHWVPILEKDVDGGSSLPLRTDGEVPNLGKLHACRRVARTVFMGSAPITAAANRGVEDRRIKLGCVMPGESPAIFGDALRRLASAATYLYQDGPRYWYSTQPTVTKLAEDRAEQLKRDRDKVIEELEQRLRDNLRTTGDFRRIHPLPTSGQDVPDDTDARLVVLGPEHPYSKAAGSRAELAARAILESRGSAPRLFRNTLVFLAADDARLQDLDEAVRRFLAWESIVSDRDALNLDPHQVRQAETQRAAADATVSSRLPETYQWLLIPVQHKPQDPVTWQATRLTGQEPLAARASKKLRNEELMVTALAGTRLRMELDRVPLWRGDHVAVRQLVEDFARYLYLPRLSESGVLLSAIRDGLGLMTWGQDSFAFADDWDEAATRYKGLRGGQLVDVSETNINGLLVRPEIARLQLDAETRTPAGADGATSTGAGAGGGGPASGTGTSTGTSAGLPAGHTRFYGSATLDPNRVGRDAARIAEEVIAHLVGLKGAEVTVTLDISAQMPAGAPENVVRTVTENARTLKFSSSAFEKD